jgi:hypothetical protein
MTEQNHKQRNTTIWGIAAQTKKIDTFKTHKKGLMQQFFAALDEVKK